MADRHEGENLTHMWTEEKLKIAREEAQRKTVLSTVLHTVMEAAASAVPWITQPLQTNSNILKDIKFESEDEKNESGDNLSYSVENSRHGTLEEISEPDASKEFERSLKKLILHLQISLQRKLEAKRKECILRWKESLYPETIITAVREINKAKTDRNWDDCVQKTNATVEMIETFPPNELPEKQVLLTYIYSYFSPTSVENGDFTKTIGYHDKDRICAIEEYEHNELYRSVIDLSGLD